MDIQEAEELLARALDWDPIYGKVRPLYEGTRELEEEYQKRLNKEEFSEASAVWWLEPMPHPKVLRTLINDLEDRERTHAEVRRRIVNVLGHIKARRVGAIVEKTLREDSDLSVQAQAAWMLARRPRPGKAEERKLRVSKPGVVEEWLEGFPSPLEYNPFKAITAEADDFLDRHFFEHPVYRQLLLVYGSQHVAIFADLGGGKTSCRRMFESSLEGPPHLVVEYTNFGELVRKARRISVEDHVRSMLRQASALLDIELESLSSSGDAWQEQVRRFLETAWSEGYRSIRILVDNVHGYAETQTDPRIAELILRHLVGNFDLLDTASLYSGFYTADLCFNFYLPLSLKERLSEYGGFRTGRIKILDMVWGEDLLHGVIKARLQAASSPRSKVDSLKALTVGRRPETFMGGQRPRGWPMDLDSLLVEQAQGSPRRLITLVNMLFQHRAQIWHESGKRPTELYITMADWATLLEHRLGQGDVT